MNNAQRFVFTGLVVVLVLQFGSISKLSNVWQLAFAPKATTTSTPPAAATHTTSITPSVHPAAVPGGLWT